jgi:hypothetical protein
MGNTALLFKIGNIQSTRQNYFWYRVAKDCNVFRNLAIRSSSFVIVLVLLDAEHK